ncbi:hypothetical protein [Streptomyces katrae]|uniref:DUF5009 domain-containing protein n=1 Tax=Streptomyces katrae TaxID=68223 RepID=A0A0F4ISK0_9ACTN|nr:hypothetical protein [Streptomyces katrae]KJY24967.1 hypothetical protein VR44_33805 [Streptomyces katrae]
MAVPPARPGANEPAAKETRTPPARRRLGALDGTRGAVVALRLFIGSQVAEIAAPAVLHADGFGLTLADLVFPGFLFMMGMAVPVSMSALLRSPAAGGPDTAARRPHLLRVARRAVLLYAIGMFLGAYPFLPEELEHLRFVGVLQRLAAVYLMVSLLYITCAWSMAPPSGPPALPGRPPAPASVQPRAIRLLARTLLLGGFPLVCVTVWTVATYTFHNPWPACADASALARDCSFQAYVDTNTWGAGHNFEGRPFDPEGIVSTLVAVANCWAGLVIGIDVVRNKQCYAAPDGVRKRASLLIAVGATCTGAGLVLGMAIPIGKQLWTPSYALVTIGLMTAGFGVVLAAFDGGLWAGHRIRPGGDTLVALGRNPLFFYILSELVVCTLDYIPVHHHGQEWTAWSVGAQVVLTPWIPASLASAVWAVLWLSLFYVPLARLLVARGWYIRV